MHEIEAAERAVRLMQKIRVQANNQGIVMTGTEVAILTLVAKLDMVGAEIDITLNVQNGT